MSGEADQVKWRGVQPVDGIAGIWPGIDAVRVDVGDYHAGSGTWIIYTVPAGKKLFIFQVQLSSRLLVDGAETVRVETRDTGDTYDKPLLYHYYEFKGQMATSAYFSPAIEVLAEYDVVLISNDTDLGQRALIHGWLEDA